MKTRHVEIRNRIKEIEIILSNYVEEMDKLEAELLEEDWKLAGELTINNETVVALRTNYFSEFSGNTFWLNDKYNWEIMKDNTGRKCLVPYKS